MSSASRYLLPASAVGRGPMVAVRAVVDVGSPIGGGTGISEARGAGGEGSAASGEASDLVSCGIPVSAVSGEGCRPPGRGPRSGEFDNSDVGAGGCQFLWQRPVTIWSRESPCEPPKCTSSCLLRDAVALLCRPWDSGVNPDDQFRFLGLPFIRCAVLAAFSYIRTGGLAT